MSIETIKKFLAEWGKIRLNGETIYGMHAGCDREVILTTDVLQGAVDRVAELEALLEEADRQLAYLDERSPSGTTPAVRAKIRAALNPTGEA